MYDNSKTPKAINGILQFFFVLFALFILVTLGKAVFERVDGDTMTILPSDSSSETCGDEQAQQAMKEAGLKSPVKCKK